MRKFCFFLLVAGFLASCASVSVTDPYKPYNDLARKCAESLRDTAFAWDAENPDEPYKYPNLYDVGDYMKTHPGYGCDPHITIYLVQYKHSFEYQTLHAGGNKTYAATNDGIFEKDR